MKPALLFITIVFFFSCNTKHEGITTGQSKDSLPQMWISGLPEDMTLLNNIAKKYGFQYYNLGKCVVSKELRDSISNHNKPLIEMLNNKYGKGWRSGLFNKVDSIRTYEYLKYLERLRKRS